MLRNRLGQEAARESEEETRDSTDTNQSAPSDGRSSSNFVMFVMGMMIIAGSCSTIFGKIMDQKVILNEKDASGMPVPHETEFKHPLLMNLLMFIGEASLLLVLRYQL